MSLKKAMALEKGRQEVKFQTKNLGAPPSIQQDDLLDEIALLKEAIGIRDSEISYLKKTLKQLKTAQNCQKTRVTTSSECSQDEAVLMFYQDRSMKSNTATELAAQIQEFKEKYSKSCEKISELERKLREVMSKAQLSEQQLNQQINSLNCDLKYHREQYERVLDNIKIQSEEKTLARLKMQEERYKKQKTLLEEQITNLNNENHEKTFQINRLTDKLRAQRQQSESHHKYLEHQNKQLMKKINELEVSLKQQYKQKQQDLLKEFTADIDALHGQQKKQIQILCKRIDTLKRLLQQKEKDVKELWKARDIQANNLFGAQATRISTEFISSQFQAKKKENQPIKTSNTLKTEVKGKQEQTEMSETFKTKLELSALQQYMKKSK